MKKTFKRLISIFIIVLLNINTFAAVSGNDGSAFITKAEFDALVNTFNEQMDNYEASLISKVDGAIANYLAGLSNQRTVTLENYAKTYATSMNVTQIEPIRQLGTDGGFAYYYKILCLANWYYITPSLTNFLGNSSNYKHTSVWEYDTVTTGKLSETDANRLLRVYFRTDDSNYIKGAVRNIQTTLSTLNLCGAGPNAGCNISYWAATVNSTSDKGISTTGSMYNWNVQYNYIYQTTSGWQTYSNTNFSSYNSSGSYNYNGTEDNLLTSQVCNYPSGVINYITDANYSNRTITPTSAGRYLYYYGEDGRTTCRNPDDRPLAYYGKPKATTHSGNATLYSAGAKAACGIDAPIYAGVPLCKPDDDGEITFTIKIINANTGDIYITDNDTGFSNTLTPTPDVEFSVDGEAKENRWTTNNGDSGEHVINFTGEKKKTYWIKYIPAANGPKYTIGDTITQFIEE